MPKTWSDADDKRLLLALVSTLTPGVVTTAQWSEVATKLGRNDSASAVMQHYNKKLKKYSFEESEGATTPKSTKGKTAAKPKTTAGNKRKRSDEDDEDDDDDDNEAMSKTTKAKRATESEAATSRKRSASVDGEDDDRETSSTPASQASASRKNRALAPKEVNPEDEDALQLYREAGEQVIKEEDTGQWYDT